MSASGETLYGAATLVNERVTENVGSEHTYDVKEIKDRLNQNSSPRYLNDLSGKG